MNPHQIIQRTLENASNSREMLRKMRQCYHPNDQDTWGHSHHVVRWTAIIGDLYVKQQPDWSGDIDEFRCRLERLAVVHDIGKLQVPVELLMKRTFLNPTETQIMRGHALATYYVLLGDQPSRFNRSKPLEGQRERLRSKTGELQLDNLDDVERSKFQSMVPNYEALSATEMYAIEAASHHENFDGSGYPFCLRGDQIPVSTRILTLADAICAMRYRRIYSKPRSWGWIYFQLQCRADIQFDPLLVSITQNYILEKHLNSQDRQQVQLLEQSHVSPEVARDSFLQDFD